MNKMVLIFKYMILFSIFGAFTACISTSNDQSLYNDLKTSSDTAEQPLLNGNNWISVLANTKRTEFHNWFQGTYADALVLAKRQDMPIFVYWGATWCPPCNELRATTFSSPSFHEQMNYYIPFHIDGDHEGSQALGEQLKLEAYPTLLILNTRGEEMLRVVDAINEVELIQSLQTLVSSNTTWDQALAKIRVGQGTEKEWQLIARAQLTDLVTAGLKPSPRLAQMANLIDLAPASQKSTRAHLIDQWLGEYLDQLAALKGNNIAKIDLTNAHNETAKKFLMQILENSETANAAPYTLTIRSHDVFKNILLAESEGIRMQFRDLWLKRLIDLEKNQATLPEIRLWTNFPRYYFSQQLTIKSGLPDSSVIKKKIMHDIDHIEQMIQEPTLRYLLLTSGASLLQDIGEEKDSLALLLREVDKTKAPWFFYRRIANIYFERGDEVKAFEFSKKARESVKGLASKLAWIYYDLELSTRDIKNQNLIMMQEERILEILDDFYQTSFSVVDGFSGRNEKIAKKTTNIVKKWIPQSQRVRQLIAKFENNCNKQIGAQLACKNHFLALSQVENSITF